MSKMDLNNKDDSINVKLSEIVEYINSLKLQPLIILSKLDKFYQKTEKKNVGLEIFEKIPEYQQKVKDIIGVIADNNHILPIINYTGGFIE